MKKTILFILLFAISLGLCACSKRNNSSETDDAPMGILAHSEERAFGTGKTAVGTGKGFSGIYEVSNGMYTDTEEWILAKDGTAVGTTSDGRKFTFEWSVHDDVLYISQLYNLKGETDYYGKLTKGDKYTVFDMQTATTTLRKSLTKKGNAPKTAFNQFPDETLLIGCYACGNAEYSFSKDGQFTYSSPADKFTCPYSVIGNQITLRTGDAIFFKADGEFFLHGLFIGNAKYGFSFDISKDALTVFSNHRNSNSWQLGDTELFASSELNRIEQLKDANFDESERDALLSATLYWTSHDDVYHTHSDCPELLHYQMSYQVQSGTLLDLVNIGYI